MRLGKSKNLTILLHFVVLMNHSILEDALRRGMLTFFYTNFSLSEQTNYHLEITGIIHPTLPAYRYSCAYPQYSPKCSRANLRIALYSRPVNGESILRSGR